MDGPAEANAWNADEYDDDHAFVTEYGRDVLTLLAPEPGERILDLGCGTGHLTREIADAGADAIGVDASAAMIEQAREAHPGLTFREADARAFSLEEPVEAVFSNAALHWIPGPDHDEVLARVREALVPGGRFVAELGGHGNVAPIVEAVVAAGSDRGHDLESPWYFPSVGEYAPRLESHGFEVRHARLFDRPTRLENGEAGLRNWLAMFGDSLLEAVPAAEREALLATVEDRLRDEWFEDGSWVAPYRRLRFVAVGL